MYKRIIIVLSILSYAHCFGQNEEQFSWSFDFEVDSLSTVKSVEVIIDAETGSSYTFLKEGKRIALFELNKEKELVNTLKWNKTTLDIPNFSNVFIRSNVLHSVCKSGKWIYDHQIDLKSGECTKIKLPINGKEEKLLSIIRNNGQVYILSISKNEAFINIYTHNENGVFEKQKVAYSEEEFLSIREMRHLSGLPQSNIKLNIPVEITSTYNQVKIYQEDNMISYSMEFMFKTYTFIINLNNLETEFYINNANVLDRKLGTYVNCNSFLYKDRLLQTISTEMGKAVDVYIKDLKTDEVLKTFTIKKGEPISFSNSRIEVSNKKGVKRYLSSSNRFIARSTSLNSILSISAFETKEGIQMNIGCIKPNETILITSSLLFGVVGAVIVSNTMYRNYANSTITSIKCLFDNNFNSLKGDIPLNIFDQIRQEESDLENVEGWTLNETKDGLLAGFYDVKLKKCKFKQYFY